MAVRYRLPEAPEAKIYFREWREWRGPEWTQQRLADELGTSKQTVSRIETGARDWSKNYLEAFAYVIGCAPGDPISRPPPAGLSPARFAELWQLASTIDEAHLAQLLDDLQQRPAHAPSQESAPAIPGQKPAKKKRT
jgi:transcriptional regulator with XRE-family HTH domain